MGLALILESGIKICQMFSLFSVFLCLCPYMEQVSIYWCQVSFRIMEIKRGITKSIMNFQIGLRIMYGITESVRKDFKSSHSKLASCRPLTVN